MKAPCGGSGAKVDLSKITKSMEQFIQVCYSAWKI